MTPCQGWPGSLAANSRPTTSNPASELSPRCPEPGIKLPGGALALLTPLNPPLPVGAFGLVTFNAPGGTILNAATRYWIVLEAHTATGAARWERSAAANAGTGYVGPSIAASGDNITPPAHPTTWTGSGAIDDLRGQVMADDVVAAGAPEIDPRSATTGVAFAFVLMLLLHGSWRVPAVA